MIALAGLAVCLPDLAAAENVTSVCKQLAQNRIQQYADDGYTDTTNVEFSTLVSDRLGTCLLIEKAVFGVLIRVTDLPRAVITDDPRKYAPLLFYCDKDGVDAADIDAVMSFRGKVFQVAYEKWLTNGEGGLPRTLKAPDQPYSAQKCNAVFEKWLKRWG